MKFVAVSGSLRAQSANTALLRAAIALAPAGVEIALYGELGSLPLFNPDIEEPAPAAVARWQQVLRACDAVVIACPEYAHGIPGAFKNALDWVVGTTALEAKPVALINTAPRATHAQAALAEVLTTMGWTVIEAASLTIPVARKGVVIEPDRLDEQFAQPLKLAIEALADAVREKAAQT